MTTELCRICHMPQGGPGICDGCAKKRLEDIAFVLASYVEQMVEDGMPDNKTELKKLLADFWKEYYNK